MATVSYKKRVQEKIKQMNYFFNVFKDKMSLIRRNRLSRQKENLGKKDQLEIERLRAEIKGLFH